MRRTLRPLTVLAMVTDTASANTPGEKGMTFADCMRDNGVSAFPDPDASGELTIDAVANGSSLDTNTAAFKQAISACKDLQPPATERCGAKYSRELGSKG
jgi:hypothetical protein